MPSSQTSQPSPQAPRVGLSQSSSTKRMSWRGRIDAERRETAEIQILAVGRRRLQDHLKLVIMLQPVRVFAVAAVGRPARRLDIGGAPRLRTRARARRSPGGTCRRRPRCHRAAGSRSPAPPNSAAISGSGPESSTRSPQCSSYNRAHLTTGSSRDLPNGQRGCGQAGLPQSRAPGET